VRNLDRRAIAPHQTKGSPIKAEPADGAPPRKLKEALG